MILKVLLGFAIGGTVGYFLYFISSHLGST